MRGGCSRAVKGAHETDGGKGDTVQQDPLPDTIRLVVFLCGMDFMLGPSIVIDGL